MRKEFLITTGNVEEYSYISGRIKILETYFLDKGTFERISGLPENELRQALLETSYKGFIKGNSVDDLMNAVFNRFSAELVEMKKYVSPGFVNAFFANKEIFLKLKKWALLPDVEEKDELSMALRRFLYSGGDDFPHIFREAFDKMFSRRKNPLEVAVVLDIYRIEYLMESAEIAGSDLIKLYYKTYANSSLHNILFRMNNFVHSSLIDNETLSSTLAFISEMLSSSALAQYLKSIKDSEQFEEFVSEKVKKTDTQAMRLDLLKVLDKGKFINVGVDVVFVYLKRLEFEVSDLSMVITGKQSGMDGKDIFEKVAAGYE